MKFRKSEGKTVEKISHGINYKVIALIGALGVVDLIYAEYFFDPEIFNIKDGLYMAGIAACGIFSILVARRYAGSQMLGKAYLFLGLGFFAWFIGDLGYYYNQFVLEIDPWPTPFDAGFAFNYVFAIMHLYLNTRYFKPKWNAPMKATIIIIPIIAVSAFSLVAYDAWGEYDELVFDIFYTDIFVLGMSLTLAFAVVGASIFRHSILKETWLLLVIGISFWAVADIIYYYLEAIEAFTHNHPINTLWMVAFMIIIYALYKHHKVL